MSKQSKGYAAEDFTHVTPALLTKIAKVVDDKKGNRYSTSEIYKAHNAVFKLNEVQQNCAQCLVIRATTLTKWLAWHDKTAAPKEQGIQIPVINVGPDGNGDPNILVTGGAPDSMPNADPVTGEPDGTTDVPAVPAKDVTIVNPTEGAENQMDPADEAALIEAANVERAALDHAVKVAPIILQKIDSKTYVATGEPLYGVFIASADDASKGIATNNETGKALAPGTYATADITKVLAVSVGGAASYKDVPQA